MPDPLRHAAAPSRRDFLKTSTAAAATLGFGATASALPADHPPVVAPEATSKPRPAAAEWRNRHPDMAYRRLGRTGFMVSEIVYGGNKLRPDNVHLYEAALDRGLNYLDQATAYSGGAGEEAVAALLKRGVSRDRFFLTSKLSGYGGYVRNVYGKRFDALPGGKQQEVQALADELFAQSRPTRPGYHVKYFDGQENALAPQYRVVAMKQLGITAGTKQQFKNRMTDLLAESLNRTTAGYYDVLYCPHSVQSPESFDDEALTEELAMIKQSGKARSLAFSCHNDPGRNLAAGAASGVYDVAMVAYNLVNHLAMDPVIADAVARGMGIIAMKVARPVVISPPTWRIAKLDAMIPEDNLTTPQKAYLFALQNPHLSAVISDMSNETMIDENLSLAGRKVELKPV